MIKAISRLAFAALLAGAAVPLRAQTGYSAFWKPVAGDGIPSRLEPQLKPSAYLTFEAGSSLASTLATAPQNAQAGLLVQLPSPDGQLNLFRVWHNEVMAPGLRDKYPGIHTFSAVSVTDSRVTARLNLSPQGFRAMVYGPQGAYMIDPYNAAMPGVYITYFTKDYQRPVSERGHCELSGSEEVAGASDETGLTALRVNGVTRKQYRLALACTEEYAAAVGGATPTKATVLAAMAVSVNRVDGVYEREIAVGFQLIANTDTLIYLPGSGDPYSNNNGSTMLNQNQTAVTNRIGSANYDIGHVFSTGGGGIANLGCVCTSGNKAKGVTGSANPVGDSYDIDYVAHEMGHQFGGNHTFNANTGSCNGNGVQTAAYEPGSGVTIMAYAGICGGTNDLDGHSIPVFHPRSLEEITNFITTGGGSACPTTSSPGNTPPVIPPFTATYEIPALTPIELTAPAAVDQDHDTLTYSWDQWNLGSFKTNYNSAAATGPIFRSFLPDTSRVRIIPTINRLLGGNPNSYLMGDKPAEVARRVTFRLTVRDIRNGGGTFNFSDDSVVLNVTATGAAFAVTAPAAGTTLQGGTSVTVAWDVSGTDVAPISTSAVDILMSTDGGYTWPYVLASGTANDGNESVHIPGVIPSANGVRLKVKGVGNVFFNISGPLSLAEGQSVAGAPVISNLKIFPNPASNELHIGYLAGSKLQVRITDGLGQDVWNKTVEGGATVSLNGWARGIYFLRATDAVSGATVVKSVSVR